jgi:threonyl-tRNA synthetase
MEQPPKPAAPAASEKAPQPKEHKPKEHKPKENKPKEKKAVAAPVANVELPPLPEFILHRMKMWDDLKAKQASVPVEKIVITLPNGSQIEGEAGKITPMDVALKIHKKLAEEAIVAKLNGEILWDMHRPLEKSVSLEIKTFDSPEGKKVFWHSSAHLLGQAMERLYNCHLCVGPPLADGGFYYDSAMDKVVSSEEFGRIAAVVHKIMAEKQPFERLMVPKSDALEMFKFNKYKVELISNKVPDGSSCSIYRCGPLIDLCKGPHVPDTGRIKAFEVWKNSSAYWLGKAENDSLQRVYGISFPSEKLLKEWRHFQEEAAKRDHRNVGKHQELFFFHQLSPGSCFFLPHGARIYNKLIEFIRGEYRNRGYTEVITPNMFNIGLWETSGHWQNYKENMFSFEVEKQQFALKPMNCPGHCLMFQFRSRSYRELPLRLADFGVLHRNEFSGALTGLTRVRRFQQDDAHIFCTHDQIKQEIKGALDFMARVYGIFGYDFRLELSTRPEKFLGEVETWNKAEKALEECLNDFGRPWKINPGDGAFYGPKIDIHIMDALKRSHQCATVQLDFQLPLRFKLEYQDEKGELKTPVIIHRALLGSVERHMGILIEHTGGKWPFWISPRQCAVLSVSEHFVEYAKKVKQQIHEAGFLVDLDDSDNTLPKKIFAAQQAQYNYILVVGEKEQAAGTVNVRTREESKPLGTKPVAEILATFAELVKEFK